MQMQEHDYMAELTAAFASEIKAEAEATNPATAVFNDLLAGGVMNIADMSRAEVESARKLFKRMLGELTPPDPREVITKQGQLFIAIRPAPAYLGGANVTRSKDL